MNNQPSPLIITELEPVITIHQSLKGKKLLEDLNLDIDWQY